MDRIIKKKKWTLKRISGLSIGGIFFFLIIYWSIFGDRSTKYNINIEKITISTVRKGLFHEYIPIIGTVIPIKTVYLDAIEGGRVDKMFVEAGNMVQKDEKLLQLDNTDLLLNIMYRETELYNLLNNLRNTRLVMEQNDLALRKEIMEVDYQIKRTKRTYEKNTVMVNKGGISRQEYNKSKDEYEYYLKRKEFALETHKQDSLFRKTQIEQLESSLKRMQSNLDIAKTKLEHLTLKAPITGHLTSFDVEIGELKSQGERLGQIDVLNDFKVRASIDEHYIARIDIGLRGEFDFSDTTYNLVVTKVYPEVRGGKFEVDMEFDMKSPRDIRRGQTFHTRLALGGLSEAVLLPRGGFYQKTGGNWIFVLDPSESFAVKRKIKLGRQNPLNFEVLEGLENGEKVVTSSYDTFGDIDILNLKK